MPIPKTCQTCDKPAVVCQIRKKGKALPASIKPAVARSMALTSAPVPKQKKSPQVHTWREEQDVTGEEWDPNVFRNRYEVLTQQRVIYTHTRSGSFWRSSGDALTVCHVQGASRRPTGEIVYTLTERWSGTTHRDVDEGSITLEDGSVPDPLPAIRFARRDEDEMYRDPLFHQMQFSPVERLARLVRRHLQKVTHVDESRFYDRSKTAQENLDAWPELIVSMIETVLTAYCDAIFGHPSVLSGSWMHGSPVAPRALAP